MDELLLVAKAMADPIRVRILVALRGRELCVCELCDALKVSQSTLSTHLQLIRKAGLVSTRKEGKWIYYSANPEHRRLLRGVFDFFDRQLRGNGLLRRDAERLTKRLAERENGECCRGFESACCPPKRKPNRRKPRPPS